MVSIGKNNEKDLLLELASGDERAFEILLKLHWNIVYSLALTYLKSPDLAKDAVQDIFMKVWEKREQLATLDRFDSYLFIITRNYVISELRRKVMHPLEDRIMDSLYENILIPDKMYDSQQAVRLIDKAIELLPELRKEMFLLSRRDNLSYDEIAVKLNVTKFSVKGNIAKALNFLRECLKNDSEFIF